MFTKKGFTWQPMAYIQSPPASEASKVIRFNTGINREQ
jgi:hypothetical protein